MVFFIAFHLIMNEGRLFGLIGHPLDHSFSATYFREKFESEKLNCSYQNFDLYSIDELKTVLSNHKLSGFNVTIPYKQSILSYLDYIDVEAKSIGAVNVVKIEGKGLYGYNTDYQAFKDSLQSFLNGEKCKALILGSGGASKAVSFALDNMNIPFRIVSRSHDTKNLSYEDLTEDVIHENHLIINTSPLGSFPEINTFPNIPYVFLTEKHFLFDLVYNPEVSLFLSKGAESGSKIKNGYEMLVRQAELSWKIWNQ